MDYSIEDQEIDKLEDDLLPFFLGKTKEEAEKTFLEFSDLLNRIAYSFSIYTGLDQSDLFGEALNALAVAKRDCNNNMLESFGAYAKIIIIDHLNEYSGRYKATVNTPTYITKANSNINKLKDCLAASGIDEFIVNEASIPEACLEFYEKLVRASERAHTTIDELIKRAEYLPTSVEYEDADVEEGGEEQLTAALMVEKLKEFMTEEELLISNGIMEGKSYEDIGKELGITKGAVCQKLIKFKQRIEKELKDG